MLKLLKRLLLDETAAIGFIRALLLGVGGFAAIDPLEFEGAMTGQWAPVLKLAGVGAMGAAAFIRSSSVKAHRDAGGGQT